MKPIQSLRFLLPTTAFLAVGTCLSPLPLQGSPGHSAVSADYRSPSLSDASMTPDAAVSASPYDAFGFARDGAVYQPVGDLDAWLNRAQRYYNRYRNDRSRNRRSDWNDRYGRSYRGYYPNDPDDRNNPRHPDYIGPPGSYPHYRSYPYRGYPGHGYYPNDPDDRNNPNHPDYIGPPRWRGW